MNKNVTVMGAGGFGISLGLLLYRNGCRVTIWTHNPGEGAILSRERESKKLLPGIRLPGDISVIWQDDDLAFAVSSSDFVLFAVPSHAIRETAARIRSCFPQNAAAVCGAKGFEADTNKRLSEVLTEELSVPVVMLSGPSHAEEVANGAPTTLVAASSDPEAAGAVQDLFMNGHFRVYTSDDVAGVELGGALKNVIALAAGICDGLGYGDNTKAALMTRGLSEIARLGVAMGARTETFAGLSGIGDLIVTCTSMHSRNRRAGILIGNGVPPEEAIRRIGQTVEGFRAAKIAHTLSAKYGVELPIAEQVYGVLYEHQDPAMSLRKLMTRPKKSEQEYIWLEDE